jgi:predicted transcriptional regulator
MTYNFLKKQYVIKDNSRFKISYYKDDKTYNIILQDEMGFYYQEEKFTKNEIYEIINKLQNILNK